MKKVLVIGGAGFLGSMANLTAQGYLVSILIMKNQSIYKLVKP